MVHELFCDERIRNCMLYSTANILETSQVQVIIWKFIFASKLFILSMSVSSIWCIIMFLFPNGSGDFIIHTAHWSGVAMFIFHSRPPVIWSLLNHGWNVNPIVINVLDFSDISFPFDFLQRFQSVALGQFLILRRIITYILSMLSHKTIRST